ncbi:alpha/beta-hydrolase [Sistotremastrum niveocremeum HHB9708]|uniref:Alpha/beta-hydrolase n=2 Tax=Sistotremastraceae TaxID=3402574 RepID=A0A164VDU8_9AGAM|nr:alpha/beta-hydrolase [Sistotremastrum niveocremeum HHB9708]KZT32980.1 alpha/beta-hydrolase [Sistotremastrum suecicum HHB10207 ss-3]
MPSKTAPYGTWSSPITADLLTQKAIQISESLVDAEPLSGTTGIYHVEGRPSEGGRAVLVDSIVGKDVFGKTYASRTGVQEYGGASSFVYKGVVYFSNISDGRVYQIASPGAEPIAVTPENENYRYADLSAHPQQSHLLVAILEDHTKPLPADVVTSLVIINTKTKSLTTLASGADFYSSATFSPDGKHVSWIQWWHPDMPWEGAELIVAPVKASADTISLESSVPSPVAGHKQTEVAQQPTWISNDTILFLSDVSGFLNPFVYTIGSSPKAVLKKPIDEDFGEPAWQLGGSSFAVLPGNHIAAVSIRGGRANLNLIDLSSGAIVDLITPYVEIRGIRTVANSSTVVFIGMKSDEALSYVSLDIDVGAKTANAKTLKATSNIASTLPSGIVSVAKPYTFKNPTVHVVFYPPTNPEYVGPTDEKPPVVVHIHGGPTGRTPSGLTWTTQYFTSRGYAWLDVNYGGSSGYGRQYIERLAGQWGVVDVDDTVEAVKQLAKENLIDPARAFIRGGSAGGYTVLASLVKYPTFFAAGTSSYGVSDLKLLSEDTHKFESRYLDKLVGGTYQEKPELYEERSPVHHAEKIESPLLILQGSIDKVVPPSQAEAILEKIEKNHGKVKYIVFEGEGHGWRKAENIKRSLEEELAWYHEVVVAGK